MAFDEIQYPGDISWGAVGGPSFSTSIVTTVTGAEQRNQNWERARGKWKVATEVTESSDMAILIAFFRSRRGKARGFRFKDWSDFTGTNQGLGFGDGTTATFQIKKLYADSLTLNTYSRNITKPVQGTVTVTVNSVTKTEGVDYTINYATGVITFLAGKIPTAGQSILASFEFDVPVRFDVDDMELELTNYGLSTWDGIPIVELREDAS